MRKTAAFALALAPLTASCAGASASGDISSDAPRSSVPIERLFPFKDGYVYSYVLSGDPGDASDLGAIGGDPSAGSDTSSALIARAVRTGPASFELRWGSVTRRFELRPDGVVSSPSGAYLLKAPLAVGASWRGERGKMRVTSVDTSVTAPAGRFSGCVETVEERGGDSPIRVATAYCPDVGIVAFEAARGMVLERAELKSFAPPVDIGPDGLTVTKP